METIIFKYLDKKYITDCSKVGNYGVYLKYHTDEKFRMPHNGSALRREVSTVFGVDRDTSQNLINKWAKNHGADSLDFYWNYNSIEFEIDNDVESILPFARRIAASTIGLDLVSVVPMDEPKGKLFFFDPQPSANTRPNNYEISNDLCDTYIERLSKQETLINIRPLRKY